MGKSSIKRLLCFMLSILMLVSLVMPGHYHVYAEGEDEAVENVKELLAEIDSLQEMQEYRVTVTREVFKTESGGYSSGNYENRTEQHITAQNMYKTYIDDMFAKRAAAKEAYDALTDEQKAQILADETAAANLAKLDPYDELPTYWLTQDRLIIAQTAQTAEQLKLPISVTPVTDPNDPYIYEFVRAYEISFAHAEKGYPCTYTLVDATTSGDSWMPDSFYEYGESNYLVAYCCDAIINAHREMKYKRINLEDADYYSKENAAHIRTIVENSYPFVSIEEMKDFLIEKGMDENMVNSLTRSDLIASVQWAIWRYSNYHQDTKYHGTSGTLEARDRRDYLLIPSLHDYRNEDWTWYLIAPGDYYSGSGYRYTYYKDIEDRVNTLTDFLVSLPGTEPEDHQIIISNVEIARTALVPGEDGTYEVEMNIFLNHGTESEEDSVTLEVMVGSEETDTWVSQETVQVDGNTIYPMKVKANNGETIRAKVDGTQKVERGVYFYETAGGKTESQCFVNVVEGTTRVHTEEKFTFTQEADMGLSVYKTATGTGLPISEIPFSIYQIDPEDVEDISEEPTEEEVEKYAVEENLIETISTDNTGYAFLELDRGTYLVVEELNEEKVRDVSAPIYVTVPNPVEIIDEDGEIVIKYEDIVPAYFDNIPVGTVGVELSATKEFNDWGKADSFTFELEAVTEDAPLPGETKAVATEEEAVATFETIVFEKQGTYSYTITEVNDGIEGISYDTEPHQVTITVKRNDEGALEAEVKYDGEDSLTITNKFEPAHAAIELTKEFNDWSKADKFTFSLSAITDGAPLPQNMRVTATKDQPLASFGDMTFEKSGTYEYEIREINDGIEGISYDTAAHKVVIKVDKENDTNKLTATVTYDGAESLKIINTFAPAEAELTVTKELTGREWNEDDKFSFTLEAVTEGAPLPETLKVETTKDKKSASFGKISYEKSGTYEYVIKEEKGSIGGISYDSAEHKVLVTVSKDEETNKLTAAVTYDGKESLTVVNPYNAEPVSVRFEVRKTIEGKPENKPVFTFVLKETTKGADHSENIKIEGEGSGKFKEITFEKAGSYRFEISEEVGKEEHWKYDSKVYDITVTVTDDGSGKLQAKTDGIKNNVAEFKNIYEEVKPPKTGDSSMLLMWYGLLATSSLSAAGIMVSRRKETDEE